MGSLLGQQKTTQETSYPDYVTNAQQGLTTAAYGIASPFAQGQKYSLAGQTADQQKAAELARTSALGAFNTDYSTRIADQAKGYNATTVNGGDITGLMNPYLESVGASTLGNMRRERDATDAGIGARNASAVAFGGSGPALERAQLNRGYGEQVGSTINDLLSGGYDRASQLAMQNAQMQNQAGAANAQTGLAANIAAQNAYNSSFGNQQDSLKTLLGIGDKNQAFAQQGIDIPKTNINWLASLIPGAGATTTSTANPTFNPLSAVLGLL